jgi:formamidopyrimidine-DNA glycosylase
MPEGPEVKRITERLSSKVANTVGSKKFLVEIVGLDPRYDLRNPVQATQVRDDIGDFQNAVNNGGVVVDSIDCYGKFIYWTLTDTKSNEIFTIFHTLGMNGTWRFSPSESNHHCMEWKFSDGSSIFYRDSRRFGTFKFFKGPSGRDRLEKKISKELGPDMLALPSPGIKKFSEALQKGSRSSWTLPKVLMNQKVIAGIGNYLKAEILYETRLSPNTKVSELTDADMENLYHACIKHIHHAYAGKGVLRGPYGITSNPAGVTGINTNVPVTGPFPSTPYKFSVYAQRTCPSGHQVIRQQTDDKRTTHWCPNCQGLIEQRLVNTTNNSVAFAAPTNYCI